MLKKVKNQKGFTLIELIVVIAILGILALIVAPRVTGYSEKARVSADQTLAQSVASACAIYISEHDNVTSTGDDLLAAVAGAGLIDSTLDSVADVTGKLKSASYTGATVVHNTTSHQVTVTLTAPTGGTNFVVVK